jgi:YfaZ precursor
MLRKALTITALLVPVNTISASAIDFRVGSKAAELSFLTQTSSFGYGGADIGFGALINEDNDVVLNGSILVSGNSAGDVQALQFGVGAKAYAGFLDGPKGSLNKDGGAIAIGASLRYVFSSAMPVAILGEAFYAPKVTSIAQFDGLLEYRLGVELEVTPSARAYIGYRNLEITFDNDIDYEVDDAAHIGVRFEF